ncbi:histidine phosphatase family protein [Lacticaseibacillus jixianensis]|uniref:Histidine phosphatase family protein n=1 Tax=Lacticaseibacillus jixianensis TaxID=2486012 RepID=A0ABW4BB59_9LACO|nr:histidine phosphatase family protein [Lacticaseibacillus jixianensis]
MKRLFIIRHGRTQWNVEKRLQGAGGDSPVLQADLTPYARLAAYLDEYRFAAAYTSPLPRAKTSAELIVARMPHNASLPLVPVSGLTEIGFGQWEGQKRADLVRDHRELFAKLSRRENDPALTALGVEDFDAAGRRFAQAIKQISAALPAEANALIVTHGGIGQLGMRYLTGNDHLLGLKNLATSIVGVVGDQYYLDVYNQTAYLPHVDLNEGNVSIL